MYAETFGCKYAETLGCMSIKLLGAYMRKWLGAKYADVGCMYVETFGCMYADFGCKSMDRLVACMRISMWKCVKCSNYVNV